MMSRPAFIQAPTYWQTRAVHKLVNLNRKLVAGRYGDQLPPNIAIEFRAAINACADQFQLPGNVDAFERDLEVISGVLKS